MPRERPSFGPSAPSAVQKRALSRNTSANGNSTVASLIARKRQAANQKQRTSAEYSLGLREEDSLQHDFDLDEDEDSTGSDILSDPFDDRGLRDDDGARSVDGSLEEGDPETSYRKIPALPDNVIRSYDLQLRDSDRSSSGSSGSRSGQDSDSASVSSTDSQDENDRFAWQDMLNNVLQGDVLKSEKTRLSVTLAHQADDTVGQRKYLAEQLWLSLRAYHSGRSLSSQNRYLVEARARVDGLIQDVLDFKVVPSEGHDRVTTEDASMQVTSLLARISWLDTLYPSIGAIKRAHEAQDLETADLRIDALQSWQTISSRLKVQVGILQKWTASEALDLTKPGLEAVTPENRSANSTLLNGAVQPGRILDTSSFVERMLKEDSLIKLFARRTLTDIAPLLRSAKETVLSNRTAFAQCGLPAFSEDLTTLLYFPLRLMKEALSLRLDSAQRVNTDDPSVILIDQLTDDFRDGLELATTMKRDYLRYVETEAANGWAIPAMDLAAYDSVLQDALRFFFKLLHWKLKTGNKSIFLKETEIVETEWDFLSQAIEQIDGGDLLVAEHFSSVSKCLISVLLTVDRMLTHRLILRVTSYLNELFELLRRRDLAAPDTFRWFMQTLDNVRQRHRKLLRFGNTLVTRLEAAAEYTLESGEVYVDLNAFVNALVDSGHFLIYNGSSEEKGVYMIGNSMLQDRPDIVKRLLTRCYTPSTQSDYIAEEGEEDEEKTGAPLPRYVLIISPRDPFIWNGRIMNLGLLPSDLDMRDRRVRIVAEGPDVRLALARRLFTTTFPIFKQLLVTDKMAHLARVNRDVKKIKLANFRLCESVVISANRAQTILRNRQGEQALLANYYTFAADLGQRSLGSFESKFRIRLITELQKFSIRWVNFICEDCVPSDSRTFRWAVQALEFVRNMTRSDHILKFSPENFEQLRRGVATCMTLLISHFDILGARSTFEAKKDKDKLDAESQDMRMAIKQHIELLQQPITAEEASRLISFAYNISQQLSQRWQQATTSVDGERQERLIAYGLAGQVIQSNRAEDQSLLNLAASASNINIRWQQGKVVGAGTYGTVYMAVNLDSGSLMAVKEIRFQDTASAPTLINQIRDEMQVMAMLHHPNIVEYFGIEVHRDKVYIFEEYCQSGSLASYLEHGGRVTDEPVLQLYASQLVDGLIYLHSKGVVHRDIKPDNILMDADGMMKLADFGSAKVLAHKSKTLAARTRALNSGIPGTGDMPAAQNSLNGTPMYMAPEVIKGEHHNHQAAGDIWSLGCVILECVTGRRPWAGLDNEWAIMFHIGISKEHPPLPNPSLMSAEGIQFIAACLTIDAASRPTSEELLAYAWMASFDLQAFYDDGMEPDASSDLLSPEDERMAHPAPFAEAPIYLENIGEED